MAEGPPTGLGQNAGVSRVPGALACAQSRLQAALERHRRRGDTERGDSLSRDTDTISLNKRAKWASSGLSPNCFNVSLLKQ